MNHWKSSAPDPLLFKEEIHFDADPFHQGVRLDTYLARQMRWRSRTSIQKLIEAGKVELTRKGSRLRAEKSSLPIMQGDRVHVTLPKPKRDVDFGPDGPPPDPDLVVLFEDRWFVALDKPPNIPVHPAGRNLYRTVITALHRRYRNPEDPERDLVPKLCHRLDLETSGVLLVAKDDDAHRFVSEMFRERAADKEYLAIVRGTPEPPRGMIDLPIGPAIGHKVALRKAVRLDGGLPSRTGYEVVRSCGDFALLRVQLYTGRHHQIRVHLAAIGHPIVGDKIYGEDEELFLKYYEGRLDAADLARLLLPRQALHAHRLTLTHPMTGAVLDLSAPLPADLEGFLARAAGGALAPPG